MFIFQLIECVSQVCGSCLEQTTWLRRNFAVKEQDEDSNNSVSVATGTNAEVITGGNYSVQAQLVSIICFSVFLNAQLVLI